MSWVLNLSINVQQKAVARKLTRQLPPNFGFSRRHCRHHGFSEGVTTHTVFSWLEHDLINLHRQLQLSDSSVETKQKQSVELLQLLDYNAAKRDARCWFIETVTSAGQDNFNYYKDRTPWPENVASAHGNVELAPLQDVHPRYCVKLHVGHPHVY